MKRQSTKILTIFLTSVLLISCGKSILFNQKDNYQYQGVDWVSVYQDDILDSIPKNKIIYTTAWGNTPDRLKPKFDINFCKDNFSFPYYFPEKKQLRGKAGQAITKTENEQWKLELRTIYTMVYDKNGRVAKYSVSGPSTIYSCDFIYDDQNRIQQISDGWKRINITYNDFDNIETITEIGLAGRVNKTLKFSYTYVAFPRY
jgi:hypothetical protein